ncbi:DUF6873 family GME fold protein [Caminicella sporogenes]|uniref:DUF6873 family GME fold protein n=1 Tax=Caminicella sporogenes TaxID=166485 RepID=UPI0025417685|nr:hypothetical protein [Caminicella sporogenes]WIF94260.1 hypothetical protein QNI18_08100 [Caminicella sporogenes]
MEKPIDISFIPKSKVKTVIVDRRVPRCIQNKIRAEGINIIKTCCCSDLYEAISCHPDILMHHVGGNEIVVSPNVYEHMRFQFEKLNFNVILGETILGSTYPNNIAYNVGRIGKFAVHNFKYTDKMLFKKLVEKDIKLINVKQGYAKCSICIVNENAVITSDKGIAKQLDRYGIDVLFISPGYIDLPGLNYGFIGGASGLVDKDKILFFGDIRLHPDYEKIKLFLDKYSIRLDYVENEKLIDLGSIIPITESVV